MRGFRLPLLPGLVAALLAMLLILATTASAAGALGAADPGPATAGATTAAATADPDLPVADFAMVSELDELTVDHATLFRLYWAFFLRDPDGAGALYWIERQERCDDLAAIAQQFAEGAEFANRYGRLDDEAFVERIYANVLGRKGEAEGLAYWTDLVLDGDLTRGEMVLHVSQSDEFRRLHPYPSDEVPGRGCRLSSGSTATARSYTAIAGIEPLTVVDGGSKADVTIMAPASIIERVGLHQSTHPGALGMTAAADTDVTIGVLESRYRDTHASGAADIVVHPLVGITAPVTGRVNRAGNYILYCTYRDGYVVINPVDRPELEVKILHVQDVAVRAGQWVTAGDPIAGRATPFPFRSQVDDLTAEPSWPHVHIETVDPSVPRKPSSSRSC